MKQLTCEMCGSTELVKKDGNFECPTCGTKYSVEEAKKMMIEGTVEVTGKVEVGREEEIESLIFRANEILQQIKASSKDYHVIFFYENCLGKQFESYIKRVQDVQHTNVKAAELLSEYEEIKEDARKKSEAEIQKRDNAFKPVIYIMGGIFLFALLLVIGQGG